MLSCMKRLFLALFISTLSLHASDIWGTDYPAALTQAASSKKPILLEFTGSDWCPPCMKLTKTVFEQPAFEDFAKENLVLVKLDFPRGKEQSADLLDSAGQELARKVGYDGDTPNTILKWVQDNRK